MAKIIHFEIPSGDPEKVIRFYEESFGWKINKYEDQDYWLINAGPREEPGINGAIYKKGMEDKTMITVSVADLAEAMERVKQAGGMTYGEIMDIPKVGKFVYAKDVEGTPFGMLQLSDEARRM